MGGSRTRRQGDPPQPELGPQSSVQDVPEPQGVWKEGLALLPEGWAPRHPGLSASRASLDSPRASQSTGLGTSPDP